MSELAERIKQGDQQAFSELYDAYSSSIYGVVLSIVKSDAAAEDIVQDVFVKVWKSIASYSNKKGTIFTWILNIARNASIDYLRKNKKMVLVENQTLSSDVDISMSNSTEQKIDHIGLRQFIDKLEPEYRQVIEFLYFNGYTQSEMADELNMALGTVKTRSRKAVQELMKLMRFILLWT
ncbi:MAG: sigma-70 family RNA polymerase sigma factor [Crocinitomicaceae bacterium]